MADSKDFGRIVNAVVEQNIPLTLDKIPAILVEVAQRGYNLRAIEEWENEQL